MASLEEQFKLAELMSKPTTQGGMSYADRPNPYGLRAFETDQGYGGEMMPKTSGWAGEIPSHESGKTMTEVSLGGEGGEPFYPMIYEGITPEEIEVVRDYEAGLREDDDPLVLVVKAKAKQSAMKRMHMHKSPFKDIQPKMGIGGIAKKAIKHVIEESKQPFIGYLKKSGEHESFSHEAAKAVDYHHSHLMKNPDAYMDDDALSFVRYNGEPVFTIKGESALDPYHPDSAEHISTLADMLKRNGADPNLPIRIEDMALPKEVAPYQGKHIGTLQEWIDMPKNRYVKGGEVLKAPPRNKLLGAVSDVMKPIVNAADIYALDKRVPLLGGDTLADITGLKGMQSLIEDMSQGDPLFRNTRNIQTTTVDPRVLDVANALPVVGGVMKLGTKLGKTAAKEGLRRLEEGSIPGIVDPRMYAVSPKNIRKDITTKLPVKDIEHGESATPGGKLTWPGADETIKEYASKKTPFPPIQVIADENGKWMVVDGSHRLEAAKLRGDTDIPAIVSKHDEEGLQRLNIAEPSKRAAKYTKKEAIQSDLRHMPYEDALDLAKKGVHLKQSADGQFVGAPRGITSLRDINKLRQNYDDMVEKGILGGDWYERAQKFHKDYTPTKEAATELSRANALFSAMADPTSNLGFTLQAHNAFEVGAPQMKVRTGPMATRYKEALESGKPIPLGDKTGIYAKYIDPSQGIGSTGVNDFRHARNFGYTQINPKTGNAVPITRGLSPQEHAWLDAETILATERANQKGLAGRTDWNPEEIQAAPWVLQKAQSLMSKSPKRFPTLESAMAEANKTYLEGAPKYQAYSTYEQIPYATSGHLTGMENLPNEAKLNYSSEANWLDQEGKDILSQKVGSRHGMLTGQTESGQGIYINPKTGVTETNPQYQARSLIGIKQDPKLGPVIQPQSASLMDAMNALRGYVDVQGASPWIKPFTPKKVSDATAIHLKLTHPITSDEMIKLNEVAQQHGFQGVSDLAHDGVVIAFNDNIKDGKQLKKLLDSEMSDQIHSVLPDKITEIKRVRTESGYPSYEDVFGANNEGTGKATQQLFDYIKKAQEGSPDVVARLMEQDPLIAEKLIQMNLRDIQAQSKYGVGAPRKDVLKARDIIAKKGLSGLQEALESGVALPATFAIPFATQDENKQ